MPYTAAHKQETRKRIVNCARELFNRKGLSEVSIDEIMAAAGLTRGGFYNHFASKDELYVEAVDSFGECDAVSQWQDVSIDMTAEGRELLTQMVEGYLSRGHLENVDFHCPMIALPSDIARAGPMVKEAYARSLEVMIDRFQAGLGDTPEARRVAIGITAVCVVGMVLARTLDCEGLATEVCEAARDLAPQSAPDPDELRAAS